MLNSFESCRRGLGRVSLTGPKPESSISQKPEAVAVEKAQQSRCSTLQAENTALKGQLQKLEGQSAVAAAGSVDAAVQEAQITVLQHQVLPRTLLPLAQYRERML